MLFIRRKQRHRTTIQQLRQLSFLILRQPTARQRKPITKLLPLNQTLHFLSFPSFSDKSAATFFITLEISCATFRYSTATDSGCPSLAASRITLFSCTTNAAEIVFRSFKVYSIS